MASGDTIAIDWSTAKADSFSVRITGIVGDIPLTNLVLDQANGGWSAQPLGGSWPSLSHLNGTPSSPGSVQVITSSTSRIADIQGNVLAAGTVIFNRGITITPPAISGTLTATYVSGLGTNGDQITTAGSLGNAPLIITVTSTED